MNDMTVDEREEKERNVSQKYNVAKIANGRKQSQMVVIDRKRSPMVANGKQ